MADIAKLAVQIVANATGVTAGLDSAAQKFKGFGSKIGGMFSGGGLGLLAKSFGPIGSIVGGAITSQMGSLTDKFKELGEKITTAAQDARRLGTTTDVMMGLEGAAAEAGVSVEEFRKGMMHFRKTTAGEFLPALQEFADRIKDTEDPTLRAAMAADKFSKSGVKFLTMLEGGGATLAATVQSYRDMGFALDDVDSSKVEQATVALRKIQFVVEGVYNKLIVALAPAISYVAQQLMRLAPFVNVLSGMAGEWLSKYWKVAGEMIGIVVRQVTGYVAKFVEASGLSAAFFAKWPTWGETVKGVLYAMATAFAYTWDTLKVGAGLTASAFGILAASIGAIGKAFGAKWGDDLIKVGVAALQLGGNLVAGFGETKKDLDAIFGGLFDAVDAKGRKAVSNLVSEYHAAAASIEGGREAMSIEARFRTEGQQQNKPQVEELKKIVEAQKAANKILEDIRRRMGLGPNLEVL